MKMFRLKDLNGPSVICGMCLLITTITVCSFIKNCNHIKIMNNKIIKSFKSSLTKHDESNLLLSDLSSESSVNVVELELPCKFNNCFLQNLKNDEIINKVPPGHYCCYCYCYYYCYYYYYYYYYIIISLLSLIALIPNHKEFHQNSNL